MAKPLPSSKIITCKDGSQKLATYSHVKNRAVIKNVREESEYLNDIGEIIQRDYYPDLAKIKRGYAATPSADQSVRSSATDLTSGKSLKEEGDHPRLDKYLANNTTEDNASFIRLVNDRNAEREEKLSKFFHKREAPALASADPVLAIEGPESAKNVDVLVARPTHMTSHNAVHFNPEGTSLTAQELVDKQNCERSIDPSNTRFKRPLAVPDKKKLHLLSMNKVARYGADGKEITNERENTPMVNGFRFVPSSPSMSEVGGADGTPLITWGELGQTPLRIDSEYAESGHYTPYGSRTGSSSAIFHIPSPSTREQLAHQLADNAGKRRHKDRQNMMNRAKSGLLSPAVKRLLSSSSKLSPLTPKLQRRPSSTFSSSGKNTPASCKLSSAIGVVRRPTTGSSTTGEASVPGRLPTDAPQSVDSQADLTADLLNLSNNGR